MDPKEIEFFKSLKVKRDLRIYHNVINTQKVTINRQSNIHKKLKLPYAEQTKFRDILSDYTDNSGKYVNKKVILLHHNTYTSPNINTLEHKTKALQNTHTGSQYDFTDQRLKPELLQLNQELEFYKQHNEALQKYEGELRTQCTLYKNITTETTQPLKELHKDSIKISPKIQQIQTPQHEAIFKSNTITYLKPKHSISRSSNSAYRIPALSLLNDEEISVCNTYTTQCNSLRSNPKRFKTQSHTIHSTQVKPNIESKALEELFHSETLVKPKPPEGRSQSCRRYYKKHITLPHWNVFKTWPASKIIETLGTHPALIAKLHQDEVPNNPLIDIRKEVMEGNSVSEYVRHIRSMITKEIMRSSTPCDYSRGLVQNMQY